MAALREAYPTRFREESKFPYKDPTQYVTAFLRAVIADSVVRSRPLLSKSPAVRATFEELHRVVSMVGQTFTCLWLIDDVDFTAVDAATVAEVTLRAQTSSSRNIVSSLLPEALWVGGSGIRSPDARRGGYLVASKGTVGDHWSVWKALNDAIGRLVVALRLGTGTTGPTRMVWVGEPSMVHVQEPEAHPQTDDFMESSWRRVGVVTQGDLVGLAALSAMVERAQKPHPPDARPRGRWMDEHGISPDASPDPVWRAHHSPTSEWRCD